MVVGAIGEYMSWVSEWQAISNRINGLKEAVQYFIQYQQPDGKDTLGKVLLPQVVAIYYLVDQFQETYKASISPSAQKCISNYVTQDKDIIQEEATQYNGISRLKHLFTSLISFQSELTFHFSDTQFVIRRITERAFVHLQRLIIVDEAIRNKWENGFKLETECEKLGATHLLLHGIWAFKAHAGKGRTDLVLGEPVNLNQVEETSEGLVLTEWKLVKDANDVQNVASVAYNQAKNYSGGVLAGIELRNYRYLVLVSEKQITTIPDDIVEGEVTYKYKNIAISPDVPSTAAKKKSVA